MTATDKTPNTARPDGEQPRDKPRPLTLKEYKERRRYGVGMPARENPQGRWLQDGECD